MHPVQDHVNTLRIDCSIQRAGPWPASQSQRFLNISTFSCSFSLFSSNFLHFLPHFHLPSGRLAHPGSDFFLSLYVFIIKKITKKKNHKNHQNGNKLHEYNKINWYSRGFKRKYMTHLQYNSLNVTNNKSI